MLEWVLKWIGEGLIFSASIAISNRFCAHLAERKKILFGLKKSMILLRGEIQYTARQLPEVFEEIGGYIGGNVGGFFSFVATQMKQCPQGSLTKIWNVAVHTKFCHGCLQKEDQNQLKQFGETLGNRDRATQLNQIALYEAQLEQAIQQLEKMILPQIRLYHTLGLVTGLFFVIVLL